jgi:hypothetical protein
VWREEVGRGSDCAREVLRPESSAWEIRAAWRGAKVLVPWELKLGYTKETEKHWVRGERRGGDLMVEWGATPTISGPPILYGDVAWVAPISIYSVHLPLYVM